jgi:predicted nucleic acid-binding protein
LLAFSKQSGAALVTFDKALFEAARKHGYAAIIPD